MKKYILAILVAICATGASAQDNSINRIPSVGHDKSQQSLSTMDKGFWWSAEALGGVSCHLHGHNLSMAEVDFTAGWRFSEYLRVGAGIGGRAYFDQRDLRRRSDRWSFPIFATARGNFISQEYRAVVPYWGIEAGSAFRDGFMWRPTIGARFGRQRNAFTLGLSYMGQVLPRVDARGNNSGRYTNFAAVRIGYEF